jgi:transposase
VPALAEMSRDELITLVAQRDARIAAMAGQLSELIEANEVLADKLARLEHLLSRNSKNSSSPPSKDDDPGKTPPQVSKRRGGGPVRSRGKQPGAAGANLAWTESPDERSDRFPEGRCECGHDLAGASDLGVVDCYQQHEIPQLSVKVTQYDQHQQRPDGAAVAGQRRHPPRDTDRPRQLGRKVCVLPRRHFAGHRQHRPNSATVARH